MSGTLTRKYHAKTSFDVSSSGYCRFHDLKVGMKQAHQVLPL